MEETTKQTIEQKAAAAILQNPIEVMVGANKYTVAPPSTATLILVSEEVSKMPYINGDPKNLVSESLSIAKDCQPLGNILAILILGAKFIKADDQVRQKHGGRRFFGLLNGLKRYNTPTLKDRLAKEVLENMSPAEMHKLFVKLMQGMDLGDFFALTTFLNGINLLHPTKVEKTEATASGH